MFTDVQQRLPSTWGWELSNSKVELVRAALTVSILVISILWFSSKLLKLNRGNVVLLPPGPHGLPIVGYLPFLGTELHGIFAEMGHKYGPIFKLWLGRKLCIVVSSASLAREVVRDKDTIFANRDPNIASNIVTNGGIDIAWAPYGSHWLKMRKIMVREMLSNASLEACYDLRRNEVHKTIRGVHKKSGQCIDVGELTFMTELNVVMNLLWGRTFDSEKANIVGTELRALTSEILEGMSLPNVSDFFPILARFDIQGVEKKMKRVLSSSQKFCDLIINAQMKIDMTDGDETRKMKKNLVQLLLELKEQEDATETITLTEINSLLMDILLGGTDTTSTVVEWAMAEIMNSEEIKKKAQEELSRVIGMNMVEESHIPYLPYLDAVVKETLRLHPAIPFLVPRRPSETCTVGGFTVPKNTRLLLNVWAIHRDPKIWENPNEFNPERFLVDPKKWDYSGNNFQYLPFGSGRRICAGIPLAEKMVMYVLASYLHCFNWELPKGEEPDLSEKFGIVLKKKTPLVAIPMQRFSDFELY